MPEGKSPDLVSSFLKDTTCVAKVNRENDIFLGRQEGRSAFTAFSTAVQVGYDRYRKRYAKALKDIPPGKVICVDEGVTVTFNENRCQFCVALLKKNDKSYCAKCRVDKRCKVIRATEDGLVEELRQHGMLEFGVRIVLFFPVAEIIEVLRMKEDPSQWTRGFSSKSFFAVFCLQPSTVDVPDIRAAFSRPIRLILSRLASHPEWGNIGNPTRDDYFCQAVEMAMARVPTNAHSIYHPDGEPLLVGNFDSPLADLLENVLWCSSSSSSPPPKNGHTKSCSHAKMNQKVPPTSVPLAVGCFPAVSILNHSCRPNTWTYCHENRMIVVSRGIRKDEEITDSYGPTIYTHPFVERVQALSSRGFKCTCVECAMEGAALAPHPATQIRIDANVESAEKMVEELRAFPNFAVAYRLLGQVERLLSSNDLTLAHSYRIVSLIAAREGKMAECASVLARFAASYERLQQDVDGVTATIAHAQAVIALAEYHRTGDVRQAHAAEAFAFRALSQMTTIYGKHGILTRSLVRFIKERNMLALSSSP